MSAPVVPLPRPIILGSHGPDVIAVKHALSRAGYINWGNFTSTWGTYARKALHQFQHDHRLKYAGYGVKSHHALVNTRRKGHPKEWAFDAAGIRLMEAYYKELHKSPETRIRGAGIQMCRYLYANRLHTAYSQSRPFPLPLLGGAIPRGLDCSGFATVVHHAAHARNPNANWTGQPLPWDGEGYTGTLMAGGSRCAIGDLKPLDLVFYGFSRVSNGAFRFGDPTHVAVFEGQATKNVFSMGSYPMGYFPAVYRGINHARTYHVVPPGLTEAVEELAT